MSIRIAIVVCLALLMPAVGAAGAGEPGTPGASFRDCAECPEMVVVPPGSFVMGSPDTEPGRNDDENPLHNVSIAHALAVGKFEMTRGEFATFAAETGYDANGGCLSVNERGKFEHSARFTWANPGFTQSDLDPVVCVNWNDANAFVAWLSKKAGKTYRLLSESEWEYAARAGTTGAHPWGEDEAAVCRAANGADLSLKEKLPRQARADCTDGHAMTALVGSFPPNAFGLHDMLGNAWEWVQDCYVANYDGAPADGAARSDGDCHIRGIRGDSWGNEPKVMRAAYRYGDQPLFRSVGVGFRVAR